MPNAKTLVTALKIIIQVQYTTGNGCLSLYIILISQRALVYDDAGAPRMLKQMNPVLDEPICGR